MKPPSDSEGSGRGFYLPNFCAPSAILIVVLLAELIAIALTLARQSGWGQFFADLAKTSLMMVWTALSVAAVLCALRERVNRLDTQRANLACFAIVLIIVALVSEGVFWLGRYLEGAAAGDVYAWFPTDRWYFLSRNLVLATIVTALGLRYLYVSHQWQRNVESEARARIHALQARIRPHFLFNSMNTIAALTRSNPQAAESAVEDLADLFRASLADSTRLIRLSEELEITRVYERMEQQRLGKRLNVVWSVDELPLRAKIPSLTLQPLLENAIYHGVEPLPEPASVEIEGRHKGDMIYISVRNPLPVTKFKSEPGNQIALQNIAERLKLALGPRAQLSRAVDQTHYQVSIAIPLQD